MPFLSGGYHLSLTAKVAISNASFIAMMWELTDEEEGWADNWEDTGAILQFAGTMFALWVPPVVKASIAARVGVIFAPVALPAAIATSAVIVGGVVSYAIDPKEGLKNYKEFISTPGKYWERTKFSAETLTDEYITPKIILLESFGDWVGDIAERQIKRILPGFPLLPF
jgi:hypothetical protein